MIGCCAFLGLVRCYVAQWFIHVLRSSFVFHWCRLVKPVDNDPPDIYAIGYQEIVSIDVQYVPPVQKLNSVVCNRNRWCFILLFVPGSVHAGFPILARVDKWI